MTSFAARPTPPLADLHEGMEVTVDFTISASDMDAFAAVSGDTNPLHCDTEFAQQKGFDGCVVYGALMIAKLSQLIGMHLPGRDSLWTTVSMQFQHPLYIGQPAQLRATISAVSEAVAMVMLKVEVTASHRQIAKGKAEVRIV